MLSAICFNLDQSKILSSSNGLDKVVQGVVVEVDDDDNDIIDGNENNCDDGVYADDVHKSSFI